MTIPAAATGGVGRLTGIADQSGSTAFTYNALGQTALDRRAIGSNGYNVAYTYDPRGNVLSQTYPSGRIVTYSHDATGRISAVSTSRRIRRAHQLRPLTTTLPLKIHP
jgi:YD repeat-containing protein